jgi:hypothetical protein
MSFLTSTHLFLKFLQGTRMSITVTTKSCYSSSYLQQAPKYLKNTVTSPYKHLPSSFCWGFSVKTLQAFLPSHTNYTPTIFLYLATTTQCKCEVLRNLTYPYHVPTCQNLPQLTLDFSCNLKASMSAQKKLRRAHVVFGSRNERPSYFRASRGVWRRKSQQHLVWTKSLYRYLTV